MQSDRPGPQDAVELSHCIDALKLQTDDLRRDQAALAEFRRQLSLHARRAVATATKVAAHAAMKETEKRHRQEAEDALRTCLRANSDAGDCGQATSAMAILERAHPRLATAFAALRGDG